MSYRDANFGFQIIEEKKTQKNILCKMAIQGAFIDDSHKVWIKSDQ
jgi:hypothetical protein